MTIKEETRQVEGENESDRCFQIEKNCNIGKKKQEKKRTRKKIRNEQLWLEKV